MQKMSIKKLAAVKTMIRNLPFTLKREARSNNYDKYVKISEQLDKDTFEYLEGLKSTIGNYAKHNNLVISLKKPFNGSKEVSIDVFAKENPIQEKFYDLMEIPRERAVKLNKEDIIVKVNAQNKEELTAPSRTIFQAISDIVKDINKTLNSNLK